MLSSSVWASCLRNCYISFNELWIGAVLWYVFHETVSQPEWCAVHVLINQTPAEERLKTMPSNPPTYTEHLPAQEMIKNNLYRADQGIHFQLVFGKMLQMQMMQL